MDVLQPVASDLLANYMYHLCQALAIDSKEGQRDDITSTCTCTSVCGLAQALVDLLSATSVVLLKRDGVITRASTGSTNAQQHAFRLYSAGNSNPTPLAVR